MTDFVAARSQPKRRQHVIDACTERKIPVVYAFRGGVDDLENGVHEIEAKLKEMSEDDEKKSDTRKGKKGKERWNLETAHWLQDG